MNKIITLALTPALDEVIKRAEYSARQCVNLTRERLEDNGWDRRRVAPYPNKDMQDALTYALTKTDNPGAPWGFAEICEMDPKAVAEFMEAAKKNAAERFEFFVSTMAGRFTNCTAAYLQGNLSWDYAILELTFGQSVERWKVETLTDLKLSGKMLVTLTAKRVK